MYISKALILLLAMHFIQARLNKDLIISKCEKIIDLRTQLIKIKYELTFYNNGTDINENYQWAANENGKLLFIEAQDLRGNKLKIIGSGKSSSFVIQFSKCMDIGSSEKIIMNEIYAKGLKPLPKEIKQTAKQFIMYLGNMYLETTYFVKSQTITVVLPRNKTESFTHNHPMTLKDHEIIYGPYENVPPKTYKILKIHFMPNESLITVPELKRKITISHWGFISVEENIKLINTGARLKGPFSRNDFHYVKKSPSNCIKHIKTFLPATAKDIYYRDDIGNISTSTVRDMKSYMQIVLTPRFALMGGWKTNYILGYKVPIYEYLLYDKNNFRFVFNMRFMDHIFNDMYVEKIETRIVLPVFANVISVNLPFEATRLPTRFVYKFLDLKPREVLIFAKDNLIENHIKDFQVIYECPALIYLYQPMSISMFLYLLFLSVIVYFRLDFFETNDKKKNVKALAGGDAK